MAGLTWWLKLPTQTLQLDMMYNKDEKTTDDFFQERGLTRGDVGTKRYPVSRMVFIFVLNSVSCVNLPNFVSAPACHASDLLFQGRTKEEGWTSSIHENDDNVNNEADENREEI